MEAEKGSLKRFRVSRFLFVSASLFSERSFFIYFGKIIASVKWRAMWRMK